jgi:hypothetical protein
MAEPASNASEKTEAQPKPPTRFETFLKEQRNGGLHNELTTGLAELVAACRQEKRKGTLTLTISVEPDKADETQVIVHDRHVVKSPEPPKAPSRFFADADGNVSRRDPRQAELPIRAVGDDG